MSQPCSPTDTQALLQSMLQRLRLQPGTPQPQQGSQAPHSPTAATQDWGEDGGRLTQLQTTRPGATVFGNGAVGLSSVEDIKEPEDKAREEFRTPSWDCDFEASILEGEEEWQQPPDVVPKWGKGQAVPPPSATQGIFLAPSPKEDTGSQMVNATGTQSEESFPADGTNRDSGMDRGPDVTSCEERLGTGEEVPRWRKRRLMFSLKGGRSDKQRPKRENKGGSGRRGREVEGEMDREGLADSAMGEKNKDQETLSTDVNILSHHDKRDYPGSTNQDVITCDVSLQAKVGDVSVGPQGEMVGQSDERHMNPSPLEDTSHLISQQWSQKGSESEKRMHLGYGRLEVLGQDDIEIFPTNQETAESTSLQNKKKKRLSENTNKRWTQKIKEGWRDRHGNFGKRGRKEVIVGEEKKDKKEVKFSPQNQLSVREEYANDMSKKCPQSPIREGHGEAPPSLSEDSTKDGHPRSASDFEFSLGSFSLLEEIFTGQEWARFLNPTQTAISANQGPAEKPANQSGTSQSPQDQESAQSTTLTINRESESGNLNSQWDFRQGEFDQISDGGKTQMSTEVFTPIDMDIVDTSLVQGKDNRSKLIQLEPMEHGHVQSRIRSDEPVEVMDSSALKSGVHLNRKRVHQSQERRGERERMQSEGGERKEEKRGQKWGNTRREGKHTSTVGTTTTHAEGGEEKEEDNNLVMSLYPLKSCLSSLFPSSSSSSSSSSPASVAHGVLRHSMSQDSESSVSMETVSKKRRMSDTRRVRFSEEVVTMPPSMLIPEDYDTEEDSGTEENPGIEEDAPMEEEDVVPAPRPALPTWIVALRRKTGRKHRH